MSYDQYLLTTMSKGLGKIIPVVVTLVIGYFVFIKLPFYFFRRTLRDVRREREDLNDSLPRFSEQPRILKLEEKIKRDAEELKQEQQKADRKREGARKEQKKENKKDEAHRSEGRREPPRRPATEGAQNPESVFELKPGEKFTHEELKAKYRELLKQSHPDKVAMMGADFRKLAEKKTKEINEAYEKLKKKAS